MTNDTTHPPGSPRDSRPTVPATADGAGRLSAEVITCLICAWEFGTVNGLWDHIHMHMLTPALYGQLSDTAKLRAALATAERERDGAWDSRRIWEDLANRTAEQLEQVESQLAAERERNAPLRQQIKAAQDRADRAKSQIHALNRIIGQAAVWVLGNRTDEHVASVNGIIEHVAKYGIDPERINQFRISIHERFKIGLLIERIQQAESALDSEAARARALREALLNAKVRHLRVDGDPWFSCPTAVREDSDEVNPTSCFQCDGKPCDHGCNCGADEHNAAIDAALAAASDDGPGAAPSGES